MDSPEGPLPPEVEPVLSAPLGLDRRALITKGIVWTGAFQIFLVAVNFVSMIVLVRLLPPSEYGRATAATGILGLINCFNCSYFIAQAIQLREGERVDWSAHWHAGFYIQLALFLVCNGCAVVAWMFPVYKPLAPLLHIASIGLLIDFPNQIAATSLRRDMDFRTLRLVQAAGTILTVVSSIGLALLGAGASALIIGSNVLHGLPQGFYLLVLKKWKPPSPWWRWPDWGAYQAPLRFGAQLSGSAVLTAARGMLEAMVLPGALGYEAVGLLNRAQVLFSTTVGRVNTVVLETVYPILPRSAANREQFSRHATLFIETMLMLSIPGAIFVGIEGPHLSRLLYGMKWVAADPLIWPGTLFAWGVATVLIFTAVLQAQNKLRLAFTSSFIAAISCLPAIFVALTGGEMLRYAWALALGQMIGAGIVLKFASNVLRRGWLRRGLLPPVLAGGAAAITLVLTDSRLAGLRILPKVCLDAALFALVVFSILRCLFAATLRDIMQRLPASSILMKAARL